MTNPILHNHRDSNKFVDVELTNLHWQADEPFYLRWYINSDASAGTYGDPCRITDVELIPFGMIPHAHSVTFSVHFRNLPNGSLLQSKYCSSSSCKFLPKTIAQCPHVTTLLC